MMVAASLFASVWLWMCLDLQNHQCGKLQCNRQTPQRYQGTKIRIVGKLFSEAEISYGTQWPWGYQIHEQLQSISLPTTNLYLNLQPHCNNNSAAQSSLVIHFILYFRFSSVER
jgi:hypothetical protein